MPELTANMRHQLLQTRTAQGEGRLHNPHHVFEAFRVEGPLNLARLAQAWERVQSRHAVLRMAFELDTLTAVPARNPAARLETRILSPQMNEGEALEVLQGCVRAPYDLSRGPLARLVVLPLEADQALLAICAEHVVCDSWSQLVLLNELWACYADPAASQPEPTEQFTSHARAENDWLASADGRRKVAERARQLDGVGPLPEVVLPGCQTRTETPQLAETREVEFTLDAKRTAALKSRGAALGLTVGALTQAAFSAVLAQLAGRTSIGVVLSTANRFRPQVRRTVGWISNKIVVPARLRHDPASGDYLFDFAEDQATALDYSTIPFATMLQAMQPEMFGALTSYPWVGYNPQPVGMARYFPTTVPPELTVTSRTIHSGWNEKSLVAYATVDPHGILRGSIAYKPFWYTEVTVTGICEEMKKLYEQWITLG